MAVLEDFKKRTPPELNMLDIVGKIKEKHPFIVVCL